MKIIAKNLVTDADRPFVCSRDNGDGTVTLYYDGDTIPPLTVVIGLPPVTGRQLLQALTALGLRSAFVTQLALQTQDAQDWWNREILMDRLHPNVEAMRVAMGRTQAQVDALWNKAATL